MVKKKTRGRNAVYSQEVLTALYRGIAQTGSIKAGWESAGISRTTYYDWMKKYEEFPELIEKAKQEFRDVVLNPKAEVLKRKALEKLEEALTVGQVIQWNVRKQRVLERTNADGSTRWKDREVVEENNTEIRPTPNWAINRILPPPIPNLADALKVIADYGLRVVVDDAELFREVMSVKGLEEKDFTKLPGLSDSDVHEVRARILGVSENAPYSNEISS